MKVNDERIITLTDVTPGRPKSEPIQIKESELRIGVTALGELRRNNMGIVNLGQITKLENHIKATGKKRYTKSELREIIGETEDAK